MSFDTAYIVIDVLLATLVIGGNVLVCFVIINSANLCKKAMYIFVTSLAFADICVGLTAIPFGILTKFGFPRRSPILCVAMLSFIVISTQISIFNMLAIAVERYLAIRHPRIHYTKLTPKKSLYIIAITWLSACLIGCLPLFGWNHLEHYSYQIDHSAEGHPNLNDIQHQPHNHDADNGIGKTFTNVYASSSNSTSDYIINITLPPEITNYKNHHVHCKFMEMMDENYMFFIFTVCVLPPLITCAVLYFIIFLSLIETNQPSEKFYDQQQNGHLLNFRTPTMIHRKPGKYYSPQAIRRTNHSKVNSKVKIVINLPPDDPIEQRRQNKYKEINKNIKKLNLSPRFRTLSSENSHRPLLTPGVSKDANSTGQTQSGPCAGLEQDMLYDRLTTISVDDLRRPNYCQAFQLKFGHNLLSDEIISAKSSSVSTSILSRSCSGHLQWDEVRRKRQHQLRCKKEAHAATVLGLIVLSFVICWMPIHILNTIHRFNQSIKLPPWLFDVGVLLSHTNSAVNFFLYSWRLKAFRKQLHKLTFKKISRS